MRSSMIVGLLVVLSGITLAQDPITGPERLPRLVIGPTQHKSAGNSFAWERARKERMLQQKQAELKKLQDEVSLLAMEISGQNTVLVKARCLEFASWKTFCDAMKVAQAGAGLPGRRLKPRIVPGDQEVPAWQIIDSHTVRELEQQLARGEARQLADQELALIGGSSGHFSAGTALPLSKDKDELHRWLQIKLSEKPAGQATPSEPGSHLILTPEISGLDQLRIGCDYHVTRIHHNKPQLLKDGTRLPGIERSGVRIGGLLEMKSGEVLLVAGAPARDTTTQVVWIVTCILDSHRPIQGSPAPKAVHPAAFERPAR